MAAAFISLAQFVLGAVLPRWLRSTAIALAIAIAASSVAYLLLLPGLAVLAVPAGVLLLVSSPAPASRSALPPTRPAREVPAARKAEANAGAHG